ncbi:hypothetical protein GWK47_023160 [Chionoecetes opilio]|uniref:Uncharacterized protein n=1 Tax=Chionoecetes opilio TaxID=41210 RepID=A0A8J4XMC1_CHIOP|nr:hypothetical protein GWK47_023160 [Chionoecetes opilio]
MAAVGTGHTWCCILRYTLRKKVKFLQILDARLPTTLWVGPKGFFSTPLLRVPLKLQPCPCLLCPQPRPGEDTYLLTQQQFDTNITFTVPSRKGAQLKVKLMRGGKKIVKMRVSVQELLAKTSSGPARFYFSSRCPDDYAFL